MNDHDFMRYSRQLLLEDIAIEGQQKLLASRVLIIGLGGLGSPAALYLAGAGVGTLTLADDDAVHLSNLQRQILFTSADIDRPKVAAAQTPQPAKPADQTGSAPAALKRRGAPRRSGESGRGAGLYR